MILFLVLLQWDLATAHRTEAEEAETRRYLAGRQQFKDLNAGSKLKAWHASAINKGRLGIVLLITPLKVQPRAAVQECA